MRRPRESLVRAEHKKRFGLLRDERHWLVHRSMVESGDDLYGSESRRATFERIRMVREEAIELKRIVAAELFSWSALHGISMESVERQAQDAIRKLREQE